MEWFPLLQLYLALLSSAEAAAGATMNRTSCSHHPNYPYYREEKDIKREEARGCKTHMILVNVTNYLEYNWTIKWTWMLIERGIFFGNIIIYCHFSFGCHAFKPGSIIYCSTEFITKVRLCNTEQISVSLPLSGWVAEPTRESVILSAELWVNGPQEKEWKATLNNENKTKSCSSSGQLSTVHICVVNEAGPMEARDSVSV